MNNSARIANLEAKMEQILSILQGGENHHFLPKAKPKAVKKAVKVQSSVSKAHHAMKAKLKASPKEVQKAFTECWMALRQDAGWGMKGNIPMPEYFELQMMAWNAVA